MKSQLFLLAVIIAACHAKSLGSSENALDELFDFSNFDPMEMMKGFKEELKEECKNVTGSDDAYISIEQKPDEFFSCLINAVDVESIMPEVERAISTDNYDILFTRACSTIQQAIPCVESFAKSLEICMDEEEKQLSELFLVVTKATVDFVCSKDIKELEAIFEAPKDECITKKLDDVEGCANTTIAKYWDDDDMDITVKNVHKLLTTEEGCTDIQELETCAVATLNQCDNKKAIDVARDIFKAVIDQTPCKEMTKSVSLVGNDL